MAEIKPKQPFIRPFNLETDTEDVIHVFRETAYISLQVEPIWTITSYLWCRPYLQLCPDTCFVVDDGNGRAVGYVIGTPNTDKFIRDWGSKYLPRVNAELEALIPSRDGVDGNSSTTDANALYERSMNFIKLARNPTEANGGVLKERLAPWPGHLHIDILPSHQNRSLGKQLMSTFVDAVRAKGCTGLNLGMVANNDGAGRFYARQGFRRFPQVIDDGRSGEMGITTPNPGGVGTIYLVKDL